MAIDIILLFFAAVGFWLGYTKGIVVTLFSVLTYVLAMLITLAFSPWLSSLLMSKLNMTPVLSLILGTFVFFIAFIYLIKWLFKKVENFFTKGKLSRWNKFFAGMVMLIGVIVFFSLIVSLLNDFGLIAQNIKSTSYSYATLQTIEVQTRAIAEDFKPLFQRYWELIQQTTKDRPTPASG